ncbi:hypothetical protein CR513_48100, partial [Mucuna pruriens]
MSLASKIVNEVVVVDNQRLENKITKMTSLVRQLAIEQHYSSPLVKVCGMCASIEHPTNACLTFSLEELVKQMAMNNIQFQENESTTIQNLQTQISQLVTIPLQPPIIIANKLQVEQKEKLSQDLKKMGDFYEHLVKNSTLRFLLKKPPKDVTLEVLRLMRKRLPQLITSLKRKTMITLTLGAKADRLRSLSSDHDLDTKKSEAQGHARGNDILRLLQHTFQGYLGPLSVAKLSLRVFITIAYLELDLETIG